MKAYHWPTGHFPLLIKLSLCETCPYPICANHSSLLTILNSNSNQYFSILNRCLLFVVEVYHRPPIFLLLNRDRSTTMCHPSLSFHLIRSDQFLRFKSLWRTMRMKGTELCMSILRRRIQLLHHLDLSRNREAILRNLLFNHRRIYCSVEGLAVPFALFSNKHR